MISFQSANNLIYVPYSTLKATWHEHRGFTLETPWVYLEIDVEDKEKGWIQNAIERLHHDSTHLDVQKFIDSLKDYPLSYYKPRALNFFNKKNLNHGSVIDVDTSTPQRFIKTVGISFNPVLLEDLPEQWLWEWDHICDIANIEGSDLYDPLSFISFLICYRLDWESKTWSGQNGLGHILEKLLEIDETKFFQAIGWITKQSWYVTQESCKCLEKALNIFSEAHEDIDHFIKDEAGHYKFMNQVFDDLGLKGEHFTIGPATHWLLASHERMAEISPLAFSAMINLFEAAYYEGEDPISRVIKKSLKPEAARGFDLHYKINQDHRHCDMPLVFGRHLAPQKKNHLYLTLALFELTLHFLDKMEQKLEKYLE